LCYDELILSAGTKRFPSGLLVHLTVVTLGLEHYHQRQTGTTKSDASGECEAQCKDCELLQYICRQRRGHSCISIVLLPADWLCMGCELARRIPQCRHPEAWTQLDFAHITTRGLADVQSDGELYLLFHPYGQITRPVKTSLSGRSTGDLRSLGTAVIRFHIPTCRFAVLRYVQRA
jgi:hypothetical protein